MQKPLPYIVHLDLDCFFVSVERIHNPSLRGKPVVVAGHPRERGVVASASYEARTYGVRSAMPTAQALKLCPTLIVVPPQHSSYSEISHALYERMCQFAPAVEMASIDEMNMELTGCEQLYNNDFPGLLKHLQQLIATEFKLPCTLALSSNTTLSKIAANTVKPQGICIVPHGQEAQFLAPLDVGVLPGVGKKTEEVLLNAGFRTLKDIQRATPERLVSLLGKHGIWIYESALGKGPTTITPSHPQKSISREETFIHDLRTTEQCKKVLFTLTEQCCSQLRQNHSKTQTVSIKIRYSDFATVVRSQRIAPTNADPPIFQTVMELFVRTWEERKSVRLLGVRLSNFIEEQQLSLFSKDTAHDKLLEIIDTIRKKHGENIIHIGKVE